MKNIILTLWVVALAVVFHACEDERGEVVSQDWTWQVDPDYVFVEMPDEFDYDPSNVVYLKSYISVNLTGIHSNGVTKIVEGSEVMKFNVYIKNVLDKDIKIRLVEDQQLLEEYKGDAQGYKQMPAGVYSIPEVTLPAGEKMVEMSVALTDINQLDELPGYLLPLRLELCNAIDGVRITEQYYRIFVKMDILTISENIIPEHTKVVEGTEFNDIITFDSDKTEDLENLKDGLVFGFMGFGGWTPSSDGYLSMNLPKSELIKGICIYSDEDNKQFGKADVYTVNEDGTKILQGTFATEASVSLTEPIYIQFVEPVTTREIRLEKIASTKGTIPELYEVELIR
ncbi:DUF1735 domain-containing protein [Bacteroides caecimuris]|uniref:DUF1735 domain-containing protein n=1 Tax=Bacteroides caecimuris TaxID=1796613 RepID=UPI00242ED18E|nr:DUF1735 domain-containing protein [Bacteroides caecimuris]